VSGAFEHGLRVRYAECDSLGVVFNAHYLAYVDIGITELWRAAIGGYGTMLERGFEVVVAEARLLFRSPARFDDELRIEITVNHLGTTSIVTEHRIFRGHDLLVECEIRHVLVERESLSKAALPDWLRDGLAPWVRAGE
jgi:acyl-CoA thioester hydrolase